MSYHWRCRVHTSKIENDYVDIYAVSMPSPYLRSPIGYSYSSWDSFLPGLITAVRGFGIDMAWPVSKPPTRAMGHYLSIPNPRPAYQAHFPHELGNERQ